MRARLIVVSSIAVAFLCGWFLGAGRSGGALKAAQARAVESAPDAVEVAAPAASRGACPARAVLEPEERSALVREISESVRAIVDARRVQDPSEVAARVAIAPPPRPDAAAARRDANQIVDRALAARVWTDRDRDDLLPVQHRLEASDWREVLLALNQAMNEGRIAVKTQGPPF